MNTNSGASIGCSAKTSAAGWWRPSGALATHPITDGGKPLTARREFGLGSAQVESAILLGLDINAGFALKSRSQRVPLPGGFPGPAGIVGNSAALAVDPGQAVIPTRRVTRIVAFIQYRDVFSGLRQSIGHCGANQAAANRDHVTSKHVCGPFCMDIAAD